MPKISLQEGVVVSIAALLRKLALQSTLPSASFGPLMESPCGGSDECKGQISSSSMPSSRHTLLSRIHADGDARVSLKRVPSANLWRASAESRISRRDVR